MKIRKLKVRQTGDYYKDARESKPVKLQIRIEGRWLHEAGFENGDYVTVVKTSNGIELKKEA